MTAENLGDITIGCRVRFASLSSRRTVGREARRTIAEAFAADADAVTAMKRLLPRHDAVKRLNSARNSIRSCWLSSTIPIPGEDGVRLIRRDKVGTFSNQFDTLKSEFTSAVGDLAASWGQIVSIAQEQLGDLFRSSDYPSESELPSVFSVELSFPSVHPPDYLSIIAPEIYRREQARVAAMLETARVSAEEAFAQELSELVDHLLSMLDNGKTVRSTSVDKFQNFFQKFREWNISTDPRVVEACLRVESALDGSSAEDIRRSPFIRETVKSAMKDAQQLLSECLVDRPKRLVLV